MASVWFIFLSMTLAVTAQYYPQQQQPPSYYPYPPPPVAAPPSRGEYGRAIVNVQQRPYPSPFYPQQSAYPSLTVGQQRPEGIQEVPVVPAFGFHFDDDVVGNIFRQGVSEQHRYLTPPTLKFKIGVVSDFNKKGTNRDEDTGNFKAYLFEGYLQIQKDKDHPERPNITLEFNEEKDLYKLESGINYGNKGFELATLNVFNDKLYACDDQTGVVYEIKRIEEDGGADKGDEDYVEPAAPPSDVPADKAEAKETKARYVAQPWLILANEGQNKGFSCEWGVVKDGKLWIGSTGSLVAKDKADNSTDASKERQFVKVIDSNGQVETQDWSTNYEKLAEAFEVNLTEGHVVHEAAAWSDALNKWVFIPRRLTKEPRDDSTWNKISTNEGVFADDLFTSIKSQKFGNLTGTAGVVGLRFIPGTHDQFILVLKAGEDEEGQSYSTLSVVDIQGKEILEETRIGESTFYSAVEFL